MNSKLVIAVLMFTLAGAVVFGPVGLFFGAIAVYFAIPFSYRINALILFALLPLGPGFAVAGLRVTLVELLSPVVFLESLFTSMMNTAGPRWTRISRNTVWGLVIMIFCLLLSFIRNPAGTANLFGGVGEGYGARAYYQALVCILAFLVLFRAVSAGLIDGRRTVSFIAWSCVVVGLLRIANYLGIVPNVPFFEGNLRYMSFEGGFTEALSVTKRVGGLDQAGGYGFVAAYTSWVMSRKRVMLLLSLISAVIVIYGGGRSVFVGCSIAMMIDMLSGGVKRVVRTLPVIGILYLLLTVLQVQGQTVAAPQFRRLERIFTGTRQLDEDAYRLEGFSALVEHWKENPFIGSGIASPTRGQVATISSFGGHGAFISVIGLFGLPGIAFLILFVFAPLIRGMRQLVQKLPFSDPSAALIMRFASLLMVVEVVGMIAGGNGYADTHLYASVALLAGSELFVMPPRSSSMREEPLNGRAWAV